MSRSLILLPRSVHFGVRTLSTTPHRPTGSRPQATPLSPPGSVNTTPQPTGPEAGPDPEHDSDHRKAHPYSLSEFSDATSLTPREGFWARHPFWSSVAAMLRLQKVPHSWYYRELVQRLEVAQMQSRLRQVHIDNLHQRFWRHTQTKGNPALPTSTAPALAQPAPATPPSQNSHVPFSSSSSTPQPGAAEADSIAFERSSVPAEEGSKTLELAPPPPSKNPPPQLTLMYHASLGARSEKERAYSRALLQDLLGNVFPASQFAWLRIWVPFVRRFEQVLGWGP